ncbi:MAG: hypothetical protein DSM106950_06310 [Stigonema ocellatum SAG 48.90 = DSM 106950]|nr:hypothetical protein [Stigonema ocellatum SAG 48.90 = DSM 106950]
MTTNNLKEVMKQIDTMTLDEQLQLIAYLAEKTRQTQLTPKPRQKWREIRGLVQQPALGEDAQTWISRSRREDDKHRESQLRHET